MSVQKQNVMAVDDSRVSLLAIKRHLAGTEFELAGVFQRAREAIDRYQELGPDWVLLDIYMPDMDGVALLERLLEIDPNARVIMVSSHGTKEKVMECLEKGATNFLLKPYDRDDLLKVLRKGSEEAEG